MEKQSVQAETTVVDVPMTSRNLEKADANAPGRHPEFLLTDTAINAGSSGGPLLTLTGARVGVNAAILIGTEGSSLSEPSAQVKAFVESVLKGSGEPDNAVGPGESQR